MQDREIAYEQNVSGLQIVWADRIERFACEAVAKAQYCLPLADGHIEEEWRCEAVEAVSARLLKSERWENVTAADISDIAYEAVQRELDKR